MTNQPSHLQIALGIHVREKSEIETMHEFGVTFSYSEVLRLKASAATAAAQGVHSNLRAITDAKHGLIQAVADNFDANISSQNGLRSTQALALLLTQENKIVDHTQNTKVSIKRIKKEDMKKQVTFVLDIKHYHGPKKPSMPAGESIRYVLSVKVLAEQSVIRRRA